MAFLGADPTPDAGRAAARSNMKEIYLDILQGTMIAVKRACP